MPVLKQHHKGNRQRTKIQRERPNPTHPLNNTLKKKIFHFFCLFKINLISNSIRERQSKPSSVCCGGESVLLGNRTEVGLIHLQKLYSGTNFQEFWPRYCHSLQSTKKPMTLLGLQRQHFQIHLALHFF